ncbi:MAG: response regulator [Anaerolineae bacterium]|nr:response regulator [Anaerolineae bacterium]
MATVMIVDDDRNTVKLLQTLLELDGFDVVIAPRGADVLPVAEKSAPDLFMVDFHLSDMQGVQVIQDLRAHPAYANKPIIMASGMNVESEALAAGANLFLVKPFDPGALAGIFNKLLGG